MSEADEFRVYTTYDLTIEKYNYRMGLERLFDDPRFDVRILTESDRTGDTLTPDEIPDANALIFTSESDHIPPETLADLADLRLIGRWGAGFDNLDLDVLTEHGVVAVHAPQGPSKSVAQATLSYLLTVAHNIHQRDTESIHTGMEGRLQNMGVELYGRTLRLVGVGQIGSLVVELVEPFDMDILAYDPYLTDDRATELGIRRVEFEDLLQTAEFISLHVPLTTETRGMFGEEEFQMMRDDAYLINTTRGGIYADEELASAIQNGWIAGAAVDVYEDEPDVSASGNPLVDLDDCYTLPHVAGITLDSMNRIGNILAESILRIRDNDLPTNILNPAVYDQPIPDEYVSPSFQS